MNPLISEKKDNPPILIVDKKGIIGSALTEKLSEDAQVVIVSEKEISSQNVVWVPFLKKVPIIPDSVYSHVFLVDDEEQITRETFSSFLKKAKDDSSNLIIISNIKNQELANDAALDYRGSRFCFYGDVIDKNINKNQQLTKFLNQAKMRGQINIPRDGMDVVYPLFFSDLISGILESAFGTSREKIYFILPKFGVTLLRLSHMIQKSNPSVKIDFVKGGDLESTVITKEGKYLLSEDYPLEKKIRELNIEISVINIDSKNPPKIFSGERENYLNKIIRSGIFFLSLFIFLPLISTLTFSILGNYFLNSSENSFKKSDFENSSNQVFIAKSFFEISNKTANLMDWGIADIGFIKNLKISSENGLKTSSGLSDFFHGIDLFSQGNTSQGTESLKNFIIFIQNEKTRGNSLDFINQNSFNILTETIDAWPNIFGFYSKKNYLLLLQDNNIVRPTGGIINSYAILSLDKGKVSDFTVESVKDSDSKLKGHVEPPFALRRYLPTQHWFLRDSNFNLDYKESASASAFFVNLETGEKVDGVISIDLNAVKGLLGITGPIYINDYNQTISSDNFLNIAKDKANDQNFGLIILKNLKKSFEEKKLSYGLLMNYFGDLFLNKDILVASSEDNLLNIFTANGLSDSLWDDRNDTSKDINDFLGINETNLDSSVGNFQINRNVKEEITVADDGNINSTISIHFKNGSSSNYKNYLRVVLPSSAAIKSIRIDGAEKQLVSAVTDPQIYEASGFKPASGLEVESYTQSGKNIFGFYDEVLGKATQTLEITYSLYKKPINTLDSFSYNLLFIKQPGINQYPFELSINLPKIWRTFNLPKDVSQNDQTVNFTKNVSGDFNLNLNFTQK